MSGQRQMNIEDKFRQMIVKLASDIEDEDLPMIKVAVYDIINNAGSIENASTIEVFTLLQNGANIGATNVGLLYEIFEVTGLQDLHKIIDQYYYPRPSSTHMISEFRRMLVDLGKTLQKEEVESVARLYGVKRKDSKSSWDLVNSLTRQLKLDDNIETMNSFIALLLDQENLKNILQIVGSFVRQKQENQRVHGMEMD
ncbi:uncharacterized protein [Antedon mediterranea]|uniref:uncharacterized protein n=1 Tax=Antedon mediterranea TaxID=105859 RepID=UPI003AF5160B